MLLWYYDILILWYYDGVARGRREEPSPTPWTKMYVVLNCLHTLPLRDRIAIQPRRKERSSAQLDWKFAADMFGGRMGGEPAGGGARLIKRKYIIGFCICTVSNLPNNIEKQRKCTFCFPNYVWGTRLSRWKYIIGLFIFTISDAFD